VGAVCVVKLKHDFQLLLGAVCVIKLKADFSTRILGWLFVSGKWNAHFPALICGACLCDETEDFQILFGVAVCVIKLKADFSILIWGDCVCVMKTEC